MSQRIETLNTYFVDSYLLFAIDTNGWNRPIEILSRANPATYNGQNEYFSWPKGVHHWTPRSQCGSHCGFKAANSGTLQFDGILPKGLYPPCLRMADRAILAGYPRIVRWYCITITSLDPIPHNSLRRGLRAWSLISDIRLNLTGMFKFINRKWWSVSKTDIYTFDLITPQILSDCDIPKKKNSVFGFFALLTEQRRVFESKNKVAQFCCCM